MAAPFIHLVRVTKIFAIQNHLFIIDEANITQGYPGVNICHNRKCYVIENKRGYTYLIPKHTIWMSKYFRVRSLWIERACTRSEGGRFARGSQLHQRNRKWLNAIMGADFRKRWSRICVTWCYIENFRHASVFAVASTRETDRGDLGLCVQFLFDVHFLISQRTVNDRRSTAARNRRRILDEE